MESLGFIICYAERSGGIGIRNSGKVCVNGRKMPVVDSCRLFFGENNNGRYIKRSDVYSTTNLPY